MTTRPDFPAVWDNTMRSSFVACPRKWAWENLDHYKPGDHSVHLHAGAAWAHGLEATRRAFYVDSLPEDECIAIGVSKLLEFYGDYECPPESAKSAERLSEALPYYFTAWPMSTDPVQPYRDSFGNPAIEFSFVLPLDDSLRHPVTGDPILYSGRADMVATYARAVTIFDDKTTKSLGDAWINQWDMRAQFTGYCWAAQAFGINAAQVIARGIGILKTKLTSSQVITYRSDYRIDRWHNQIVRDIRRAIAAWEEGYFDYNESDACTAYGGCIFKNPCMTSHPEAFLETNFTRRKWDPVTRTETLL